MDFMGDIYQFLHTLMGKNVSFVAFSFQGTQDINIFIQTAGFPKVFNDYKSLAKKTGFILAPFDEGKLEKKYFLQPDIIVKPGSDLQQIAGCIDNQEYVAQKGNGNMETTEKEEFLQNVVSIKNEIAGGNIKKAVLSRIKKLQIKGAGENLHLFFETLNNNYPGAFCYFAYLPGLGNWLGATPEPLLQGSQGSYSTVALAGTKYLNGTPIEEIEWSVKEIDEQALVSNYIRERLDTLHIQQLEIKGPYNQKAAKLVHLKTEFSFSGKSNIKTTETIIRALHPTPSVCGYPSLEALEVINRLEKHNRTYYAGLLGPVNFEGSTNIFVNLRCMHVLNDQVVLYAGAGITAGSDPEKEWQETEQKLDTMHSVVHSGGGH
jgi:isochorismate synthase